MQKQTKKSMCKGRHGQRIHALERQDGFGRLFEEELCKFKRTLLFWGDVKGDLAFGALVIFKYLLKFCNTLNNIFLHSFQRKLTVTILFLIICNLCDIVNGKRQCDILEIISISRGKGSKF